ncbi:Proton-dependent oligopeptide transporter family and Major facilitator superfamily domain, general substrate transporter-containing protein [Strongyloides ratti]|uniref:Oligopeptide transporter 1 n=1 Tax=Strongyloides ratti TaxID=34506 RepID=A0A090LRW4_STRRB|nr:Proton-dependent oligopeptide transporter family and Major facilitator superfamily domain, general substrate transporter-containing protein [Strongyloides ratti]CEF70947.1 Proton-dependent oligopeptide transporter family and Major facilitator superfamily domain, general substrate transporter-containing protein [Strongyloides ratti]
MGELKKRFSNELIPEGGKFEKHNASISSDPEPTTFGQMVKKWPKSTFCIIGNEFCERFSYYGMRAVLTLYLINVLSFDNSKATIFFHAFTVFAYTSPLVGSVLADGYIGKFWTIFSISLLYAAGQVVLAVSSTISKGSSIHPGLDILGLAIIAFGTGGIKPCVSAFGADQFPQHYTTMISYYFSIFYFMINAGSTISMVLTPEFRATPCLGYDSCFPLAFGIPAVLMLVATGVFMIGSFSYIKLPPKENVVFRVIGTIWVAIKNKFSKSGKRDHWLEHFLDTHNCKTDIKCITANKNRPEEKHKCVQIKFVEDVKSLIRVCVMMLPVPMFWALYDQQGSKWIIQALAMDAQVWDGFELLPDQMGVLNAIFILIAIPLFQAVVYPLVEKCGIRTTLLRRMIVGGLIAAGSFVIAGIVQIGVNQTLPDIPNNNEAYFSVVNGFKSCDANVYIDDFPVKFIPANGSLYDNKVEDHYSMYRFSNVDKEKDLTVHVKFNGTNCMKSNDYKVSLAAGKTSFLFMSSEGSFKNTVNLDKPQEGEGESSVTINFMIPCTETNKASLNDKKVTWANCGKSKNPIDEVYFGRLAVCIDPPKDKNNPCDPRDTGNYYVWKSDSYNKAIATFADNSAVNYTKYENNDIKRRVWKMYYVNYTLGDSSRTPASTEITAIPVENSTFTFDGMGGVYQYQIYQSKTTKEILLNRLIVVPKNHLSILLQIPQYIVITVAEILFSITGLEFAYSQAAPSMKSVVQAVWLITVAFGDLIIIIIEVLDLFENRATEMFAYAGAMVVVIGVFLLLSIFYYEYVDYSEEEKDDFDETSIDSTFKEPLPEESLQGSSTYNEGYETE